MAITASIIGATFLTVMLDGQTHTIDGSNPSYTAIREALKIKDYDTVERLINVKAEIERFVMGQVEIRGDQVFYGDREVKGSVVKRILSMSAEGFDAQPMIRFLENLMGNPSKRAADELYGFLEASALPITEDGCFLAYKKVNDNYLDLYTGKVTNKLASLMTDNEKSQLPMTVGDVTVEIVNNVTTLSMHRNQVDENKDVTCSQGLHFCSLSYLPNYWGGRGRVLIVKVNPADVVAIPSDYNNAKGRTCRYEVVGEHSNEYSEYFTAPVYNSDASPAGPTGAVGLVGPVAPVTPTPTPVARPTGNPALVGYNRGRSDASRGVNRSSTDFGGYVGVDADRYITAYAKGYASIVPGEIVDLQELVNEFGLLGEDDYVDCGEKGYEDGHYDASRGLAYDDTPPTGIDHANEYKEGYADGWRDQKVSRL